MKTQPPRLLLLAPAFWPPHGAEALTNYKLWKAAVAQGWQVDVIARKSRSEGRYPNQFHEDTIEFARCVHLVEPVDRFQSKFLANFAGMATCRVIERGWAWTYPACRQAEELINRHQYRAVISRCLPVEGHLVGLWIKKRYNLPWIANWNDPEPLEMRPHPYIGQTAAEISWQKRQTLRQIARHADWHTFPCERLRRFIAGYLPVDILKKSSVIPHIALVDWGQPLQPHKKLRLFHAGDIRPPRSAETFLLGLNQFVNTCPRAADELEVLFAGPGAELVAAAVEGSPLTGIVRSLGLLGYQETSNWATQVDVGMIIEANTAEGIFLPSKVTDLVQSGLPLLSIGPQVGTLPDLIGENGGGIAVDINQPAAIADALQRIWRLWTEGQLLEKLSSRQLLSVCGEKVVMAGLAEILDKLERQTRPVANHDD